MLSHSAGKIRCKYNPPVGSDSPDQTNCIYSGGTAVTKNIRR